MRAARTTACRIFDQNWIDAALLVLVVTAVAFALLRDEIVTALIPICAAFLYRSLVRGHRLLLLLRSHGQRLEEGRAKLRQAQPNNGTV